MGRRLPPLRLALSDRAGTAHRPPSSFRTERVTQQQVIISAWPVLPPSDGVPQTYGLYLSSAVNTATGQRIEERGISEAAVRRQAERAAEAAWGAELIEFLNAEDLFAERLEAGDVDSSE